MPRVNRGSKKHRKSISPNDLEELQATFEHTQLTTRGGQSDSKDTCNYVLSPHWPLMFEKLEGTVKDDEFESEVKACERHACISSEAFELQIEGGESCFSGAKQYDMYRATLLALQAHAFSSDAQASSQARKALKVS